MKKALTYILGLSLVAIVTAGSTYAYFVSVVEGGGKIAQTHVLEVIYTGDTEIKGNIDLVTSKEGGHNRTISIRLSENSVGAAANFYIAIDEITAALATEALNWEFYKLVNGEEQYVDSGTFMDCGAIGESKTKCSNGKRIYMLTDYTLSTTEDKFKVYIWLNGHKAGNEVLNAVLTGYIGAETENISGILE